MARSASPRVSNRMKPTPFDRPAAYMCLKIEVKMSFNKAVDSRVFDTRDAIAEDARRDDASKWRK